MESRGAEELAVLSKLKSYSGVCVCVCVCVCGIAVPPRGGEAMPCRESQAGGIRNLPHHRCYLD